MGITKWKDALEAAMSLQHLALVENGGHRAEVAEGLLEAALTAPQHM